MKFNILGVPDRMTVPGERTQEAEINIDRGRWIESGLNTTSKSTAPEDAR